MDASLFIVFVIPFMFTCSDMTSRKRRAAFQTSYDAEADIVEEPLPAVERAKKRSKASKYVASPHKPKFDIDNALDLSDAADNFSEIRDADNLDSLLNRIGGRAYFQKRGPLAIIRDDMRTARMQAYEGEGNSIIIAVPSKRVKTMHFVTVKRHGRSRSRTSDDPPIWLSTRCTCKVGKIGEANPLLHCIHAAAAIVRMWMAINGNESVFNESFPLKTKPHSKHKTKEDVLASLIDPDDVLYEKFPAGPPPQRVSF